LGRRRKKVVKVYKRSLPKFFICPRCGGRSIEINVDKDAEQASVKCSLCGLKATLPASQQTEPVDLYCKFSDLFHSKQQT
jgi:transcription elongation factor Elf1